jgi:DNA-binding NtrC family response regulator
VNSPARTVLVVDDDASIRLLCRLNLELDGWQVLEAATLDEARDQLVADDVDVVVLDVHVGSASGIDFLHELRSERPALNVALLTGAADVSAADTDAVIPKPFTIEQLTSTVSKLAG